MTSDRVLTLIAIIWFLLTLLYLAGAGILPADAAPIPGGEDTPMTCGIWTYYAAGVAERAQAIHGVPACAECAGLAITVDQALLGRRIEIRHAGQWHGPFLVVDVGTGTHRPHLVGEVDYPTAVAWGIGRPWWTCYRLMEDV